MNDRESNPLFTPFGYLQNPYHQCDKGYKDTRGGILRSDDDYPGFGWYDPNRTQRRWYATFGIGAVWNDSLLFSRSSWAKQGYGSDFHSWNLFSYRLKGNGHFAHITYFQSEGHSVSARVDLRQFSQKKDIQWFWIVHVKNRTQRKIFPDFLPLNRELRIQMEPEEAQVPIKVSLTVHGQDGPEGTPKKEWVFGKTIEEAVLKGIPASHFVGSELYSVIEIDPSEDFSWGTLRLHGPLFGTEKKESDYPERVPDEEGLKDGFDQKRKEMVQFWDKTPRLVGDWDESVKNGFWYDFDTTRMCTYPPKGVFRGAWPSWMIFSPRAVLAEGAMDMNRLGYVDMELAKESILTLFRDTGANVPCLFSSGVPNMVAVDGSICGTSPAWCLPFHQIYQLYLRDPDQKWIAQLYPFLKAYHLWWNQNRTDKEGFVVYCCTWEAGEDDSPRLDPNRTGGSVISEFVRPVELQASMVVDAHIMAFFAQELGNPNEVIFWNEEKDRYLRLLHRLWDPKEGRYRDWDKANNQWLSVRGIPDYWNADFTRFSPLSITAVLFGLIGEEQLRMMKREIPLYLIEPFNVWPSWNYTIAEAATEMGLYTLCSEFSWQIVQRVYRENDRRTLDGFSHPYPGSAREYWPLDPRQFKGNDAYAWGGQTALLMIRQILGFRSSEGTQQIAFELCPSLPFALMEKGKQYGIQGLYYRGFRLDVVYTPISAHEVEVKLILDPAIGLRVERLMGEVLYQSDPKDQHQWIMKSHDPVRVHGIRENR